MAVSLLSNSSRRRDQIISIDLGARSTKAVHIQRKGDRFNLLGVAVQDAPIFEKTLSIELLTEHLKSVTQELGNRTKQVVLVIGISDSLLRHAELPLIPVSDMRLMLRFNSKNYLQQDLPDFVYDCQILPSAGGKTDVKAQKCSVLVGGAKQKTLDDLVAAAKAAGLAPAQIAPSQIAPANAFEMAHPDIFANEVVALVDLGFKNSSICVLNKGELSLSRVVAIGGDKLTNNLAESLSVSYAEAEGIKVGLPDEVQGAMQALLTPLGRELRASIDFFEHQQDKTVSQVFISGGPARSQFAIDSLQTEMMVQCKSWNPASFLNLELPPKQLGGLEQIAPQLAIAIGGAISAL